jgi:hypothetical protein
VRVVVSFEQELARTIAALGYGRREIASGMDAIDIKIDGLVFDRANYDADGEVLFLARGASTRRPTRRSRRRATASATTPWAASSA